MNQVPSPDNLGTDRLDRELGQAQRERMTNRLAEIPTICGGYATCHER